MHDCARIGGHLFRVPEAVSEPLITSYHNLAGPLKDGIGQKKPAGNLAVTAKVRIKSWGGKASSYLDGQRPGLLIIVRARHVDNPLQGETPRNYNTRGTLFQISDVRYI